jgi:hypothetical protein
MGTVVALTAAISLFAGEAKELKITNVRETLGALGPAWLKPHLCPGCCYAVAFDIEGITIAPDGKVVYSMGTEVTDATGKMVFRREPRELEAVAPLGGNRMPAFAQLDVGLHQPPGDYTFKVTVTDGATKKSQSFSRKVHLNPPQFGLVRVTASTDQEGAVPAAALGVGQSLWVGAAVIGFTHDKQTKHPHVRVSLRVLDSQGKPTLEKPFVGELGKDVPANALSLPAQFCLLLNRPGDFSVELHAKDVVSGKTAEVSFPITVVAATTAAANGGKP